MPYSKTLAQDYTVTDGKVIFQDGVAYSQAEMKSLKGASADELVAVHKLKRAFGGRVLPRQER
jgi:hypothetical protein